MNKTTTPRIIRIARTLFILSAVAMCVMLVGKWSGTLSWGNSRLLRQGVAQLGVVDYFIDPDGIIHYYGSPTVSLSDVEDPWVFRLEVGKCVSTLYQEFRAGDRTPYIKLANGKGKIVLGCRGCTDAEIDLRDSSTSRMGKWECNMPLPPGESCMGLYPAGGARVVFLPDPELSTRRYDVSFDICRTE